VSQPPSFSIVICNRDYERYLAAAIDSALGQDFPAGRFEVIVVDDGSTDGSREILRRYAAEPRLKVLLQENAGQAAAFASGVAQAQHGYVCLLDSDDVFRRDKLASLERRIATLGPLEDLFLCHDLEIYDEVRGAAHAQSWFELAQLTGRDGMAMAEVKQVYPFSMPTGQVYSRSLLADILEGVPAADWRTGADNPIVHAALLRTGRVHYMGERLAQYRMHGANRLFTLDSRKHFVKRPRTQALLLARRPKLLWYLERYVDTLQLEQPQREERLAYLKGLGLTLPVSSAFAKPVERLSFIVGGDGDDAALAATREALAAQTHPACEVLVAGRGERAMLEALQRASGQFVALIAPGDRPDRDFAERHLYIHRYLPSGMVSACDYRLETRGIPAQEGGYGRRKLWPERRRVAAMMRPQKAAHWWLFSPRSGNVLRRTAMLDLFVAHALREPPAVEPVEWLLLHYAAALGGCMQFAECLTTLRYESRHPGAMHAREPDEIRYVPRLAQPQAAAFYLRLMSAHFESFHGHFGDQVRRFARWALQVDAEKALRVEQALPREELHPRLAAALGS